MQTVCNARRAGIGGNNIHTLQIGFGNKIRNRARAEIVVHIIQTLAYVGSVCNSRPGQRIGQVALRVGIHCKDLISVIAHQIRKICYGYGLSAPAFFDCYRDRSCHRRSSIRSKWVRESVANCFAGSFPDIFRVLLDPCRAQFIFVWVWEFVAITIIPDKYAKSNDSCKFPPRNLMFLHTMGLGVRGKCCQIVIPAITGAGVRGKLLAKGKPTVLFAPWAFAYSSKASIKVLRICSCCCFFFSSARPICRMFMSSNAL